MQQDTIIEGNVLIAKFDGWICDGDGNWKPLTGSYWKEFKDKEFSYHENWSSIMPIIAKIKKMQHDPKEMFMGTTLERKLKFENVLMLPIFSSIESVHRQVLQFINWYNSISKEQVTQ